MTEHITITKAPDLRDTLDFEALLAAGIKAAQQFSGEEWTDYNAHDPGVTILEALVFALTDIAYRTDHPIEDILASSAKNVDPDLARQVLYPGPQAFSSAPVTQNDYRKLLYDQIEGLRNAWILPHPGIAGQTGHYDVWIQPYAADPDLTGAQVMRSERKIEDDTRKLLGKTRALGVDFRHIQVAPPLFYTLGGDITLAPEAEPDAALAALLFAGEIALNPPPDVADLDVALARGAAPETLFEGPELDVGLIPDIGLRPPGRDLDLARIRAAILALPEIETAHGLTPRMAAGTDLGTAHAIPTLSRNPNDLAGLRVFRRDAQVDFDPEKVLLQLRHLEEKLRWDEHYMIRRVANSDYARVTLGNPDRALSRYRSIQHMFPAVYGIGPHGVEGSDTLSHGGAEGRATRNERQARARQLKAYLALFEQLLANHLTQLDATADLLALPPDSADRDAPTYRVQPLTRPEPTPDDAPGLGPVLGQPAERPPGRGHDWFDAYCDGIAALRDDQDNPLERRNRALDHLLARFGERIDTRELKRLYDTKSAPRETFERWLLDRKTTLLREVIPLGKGRGLGVDLATPENCPLLRRISLRSGHDAPMFLVEHVLLEDDGLEGRIGTEEIGTSFAISAPLPRSAFRVALGPDPVHWVLPPHPPPAPLALLLPQLCALGADPSHYTVSPQRGYGAVIHIAAPGGLSVDVVENFRSVSHAAAWVDRMVAFCRAAQADPHGPARAFCPAMMPLDFASRGASLILAPEPGGTSEARRAYLADIADEEIPAHMLVAALWLDPDEVGRFAEAYKAWCAAQNCVRSVRHPGGAALTAGGEASQTLRRWIHDLFCREFRALRAHRRSDAGRK